MRQEMAPIFCNASVGDEGAVGKVDKVSERGSFEAYAKVDADAHYHSSLVDLAQSLIDAISVSQATKNLPTGENGKRFWASVLLSRLCCAGASLQRILPFSPSCKAGRVWDSGGALSLCRVVFETSLAMFYFCLDEMSDDDYNLRIRLMFLHDCNERPRIVENIGGSEKAVGREFHANEADRLRDEIIQNKVFISLPEKKQKRLLEGKTPYYLSQDELLQRQGNDAKELRGIWELLSSHVHSYPFSFYRVVEHPQRGTGRENEVDKGYCGLAAALAAAMLASAAEGMKKLFPEVSHVPRCVVDWDTFLCSPVRAESQFVFGMAVPN